MREDGHLYLEDSSLSVKVSFSNLERVDGGSYFTEGSMVLARGLHHSECFHLTNLRQPPLHARKSFIFKLNQADYFGAYTRKKQMLAFPVVQPATETKTRELLPPADNCIVILSQVELDLATT